MIAGHSHSLMRRKASNCSPSGQSLVSLASQQSGAASATGQTFATNMIAKLSSGATQTQQRPASKQQGQQLQLSSSQLKRKRAKLLDLLLNTSWSKQSGQSNNLIKLHKILLLCDANFLDEKTGQPPISLAIISTQINASPNQSVAAGTSQATSISLSAGCPQSASLFNLQCQSAEISPSTLQQTNIADLSCSRAPIVERILLLLVKSGAQVDFRNSDGQTPLHVAAMKSNFWALKTLLDLGASTDYRDINGLTPLYYSILHKANLKVTQLLLSHNNRLLADSATASSSSSAGFSNGGATSIGVPDQHGWQEVHQACKLGLDAHLEKLLYYGCDINAKISGSGNTPLHVAAINDQLNCAKILLLRGADKTITNNSHQTAHQVAVISNNMDLAEFIAEHTEAKVVPFRERPTNFHLGAQNLSTTSLPDSSNSMPRSSTMVSVQQRRAIVQPQVQLDRTMDPLVLDVSHGQYQGNGGSVSSGTSQPQSLLSISGSSGQSNQLNVQINNISPCLSQYSCATSNTTSSSGVCCDGDGNNSAEELAQNGKPLASSHSSQLSNVTIISINNKGDIASNSNTGAISRFASNMSRKGAASNHAAPCMPDGVTDNQDNPVEEEEDDDLKSSSSSSGGSSNSTNGLYSLMSEERPLFVGTIVEATSEYHSGDPNHLQLNRGDLIEVLEFKSELLQAGQMPRLANKPMLYGRRLSDNSSGLFPSFCVHRTKQRSSTLRQRLALNNITNIRGAKTEIDDNQSLKNVQPTWIHNIRGSNLPDSQSMATLNEQDVGQMNAENQPKQRFREVQVTLTKSNGGFGFVLRGAKVDPTTLAQSTANIEGGQSSKVIIDERLMAANNLISLQYLDEIELGSVAQQAGLRRGDFLVAVNQQDVRLCSHEQVVHMIRQSGNRVDLTIATPIKFHMPNYTSRTLGKVKPEPPKRDPTTTLTRNRAQRVKSMLVQMQHHQSDLFDADKPLPITPQINPQMSPTGSLQMVDHSITPNNLAHFRSAHSLSSSADTQSLSSVSTVGADQQLQQISQQATPTHSSSSTATLTTVAVVRPKPVAPPKPGLDLTGQSIYQPAVITTKRVTQPSTAHDPPKSPPDDADPAPVSGPPPPPPPPLPDFKAVTRSPHLNAEYLRKRRTSAPIIQAPVTDSSRLMRKRESLATVGKFGSSSTNAPVPAQFGAVAAACAAAANNRILRQQQQTQDGKAGEELSSSRDKILPELEKLNTLNEEYADHEICSRTCEKNEQESSESKTPRVEHKVLDAHNEESKIEPPPPLEAEPISDHLHLGRQQMSATLGRRSSAQIIQQPKHHSQSQTLRARPKRPTIPSYQNMMSIPPPPPPLLDNQVSKNLDQKGEATPSSGDQYTRRHFLYQQVDPQNHLPEASGTYAVHPTPQCQDSIQKRGQSVTVPNQSQQQLLNQQMRQNQLLQQQLFSKQQQQDLLLDAVKHESGCECHHSNNRYDSMGSVVSGQQIQEHQYQLQLQLKQAQQHQHHHQQQQLHQQQITMAKSHSHQRPHHHHHHPTQHRHIHTHTHGQDQLTTSGSNSQHQHHQHHHSHQHRQMPMRNQLDPRQYQHQAMGLQSQQDAIYQRQQQQLYQQLQKQHYIERYLPLVYTTDSYATITRDS